MPTNTTTMLTTFDNPYDPFDQFASWYMFDVDHGYNTCSRLSRILDKNGVSVFEDLSEAEISSEMDKAIEEVITYDFMNIYKKVEQTS